MGRIRSARAHPGVLYKHPLSRSPSKKLQGGPQNDFRFSFLVSFQPNPKDGTIIETQPHIEAPKSLRTLLRRSEAPTSSGPGTFTATLGTHSSLWTVTRQQIPRRTRSLQGHQLPPWSPVWIGGWTSLAMRSTSNLSQLAIWSPVCRFLPVFPYTSTRTRDPNSQANPNRKLRVVRRRGRNREKPSGASALNTGHLLMVGTRVGTWNLFLVG